MLGLQVSHLKKIVMSKLIPISTIKKITDTLIEATHESPMRLEIPLLDDLCKEGIEADKISTFKLHSVFFIKRRSLRGGESGYEYNMELDVKEVSSGRIINTSRGDIDLRSVVRVSKLETFSSGWRYLLTIKGEESRVIINDESKNPTREEFIKAWALALKK